MPKVAIRSKATKANGTTIEQTFEAFLHGVYANLPARLAENVRFALSVLRNYLNAEAGQENASAQFCTIAAPAAMIKHLDYFLRYRLMRELVMTGKQQEFISHATYDYCGWLYKNGLLSDADFKQFVEMRDDHLKMWERAESATQSIANGLTKRAKSVSSTSKIIELAKHDILKIEGDKIWLEIWAPMFLPEETTVGPITLPAGVAPSLVPGWMMVCELKQSKSGWQITEIEDIRPSLPF